MHHILTENPQLPGIRPLCTKREKDNKGDNLDSLEACSVNTDIQFQVCFLNQILALFSVGEDTG